MSGTADSGRRSGVPVAVALVLDVVGAAVVLLFAGRTWLSISSARPRPLADAVAEVSGRSLDASLFALALVALAAAAATIATRGRPRQLVGVVAVASGAVLCWRSAVALAGLSPDAARARLTGRFALVPDAAITVTVHPAWPALSLAGGVLVLLGGVLTAARRSGAGGLSVRHEAPAAQAAAPVHTNAALWSALDRGSDPTLDGEQDDQPAASGRPDGTAR